MLNRPNILFVFPDQQRPDWVGFNSDVPVRTPTLDALAEQGVAFRNAVCPSPLCGPSRACLASGMEYDRCGIRNHDADYPLSIRTLYERLRDEAGYHVAGTGKFDLQKHANQETPDVGLGGAARLDVNGFTDGIECLGKRDAVSNGADNPADPYMAFLHDRELAETHVEDFQQRAGGIHATYPTSLPEEAYCDNWIGEKSLEQLRAAPLDHPWFLQVNFAGPHSPWDVTEELHDWYRNPPVDFPDSVDTAERLDSHQHQEIRRNYAAMVENIDRWLDRFLEVVDERGEMDETLVVFASDHGELLGDHGRWAKRSPYRASTGVPLVVAGPGVESRGVVDVPATILDLYATFLDVANIDPGSVDSRSICPYLTGKNDAGVRDIVFSGMGHWRLAFDGLHKLICGYAPGADDDPWNEATLKRSLREREPILFDFEADPDETENLVDERPDDVNRLRTRIREELYESGPTTPIGDY